MNLVVVSDSSAIQETVEQFWNPEISSTCFSREELFASDLPNLDPLLKALQKADGLLMEWNILYAFELRSLSMQAHRTGVPLVGVYKGGDFERTAALLAGADACVQLPLSLSLLKAIILAFHRMLKEVWSLHAKSPAEDGEVSLHVRPTADTCSSSNDQQAKPQSVVLNRASSCLTLDERHVQLTPRECELLTFLMNHQDSVVSRDRILDEVWELDFDTGTNTVDVYVHYLRHKLEAAGLPNAIRTIRGKGYRLQVPDLLRLTIQ